MIDLASVAMIFGVLTGVCAFVTLIFLPRTNQILYQRLGRPPSWFDPQALVLLRLLRPKYLRELQIGLRILVIAYAVGFLVVATAIILMLKSAILDT